MRLLRHGRRLDLAILAAVVALGGAALADALHDGVRTAEEARNGRAAADATTDEREASTPSPPEVAASGLIAFTAAGACELRAFDLRSGRTVELPRLATTCQLWAPRVGTVVAYGVLPDSGGVRRRFSVRDLEDPQASIGEYETILPIAWGPEGSTLAWCDTLRSGFELSLGQRPRRLDHCPWAYDPDGVTAAVNDRQQILIGGRALLRARGRVWHPLAWGLDGSLAVIVDGRRVDRYEGDRLVSAAILPPIARDRPIDLAPDNCAALATDEVELRVPHLIHLVDLGCFRGRAPRTFEGSYADWSPDGEWIVVAEPDAVVFHRVVGREASVRWNVAVGQVAWLSG